MAQQGLFRPILSTLLLLLSFSHLYASEESAPIAVKSNSKNNTPLLTLLTNEELPSEANLKAILGDDYSLETLNNLDFYTYENLKWFNIAGNAHIYLASNYYFIIYLPLNSEKDSKKLYKSILKIPTIQKTTPLNLAEQLEAFANSEMEKTASPADKNQISTALNQVLPVIINESLSFSQLALYRDQYYFFISNYLDIDNQSSGLLIFSKESFLDYFIH